MHLRWFYFFFVISGFCSLTYEVVWLRLAMAHFGVNTPFVAIVLSVFMGGIAIGSVLGGRLAARLRDADPGRALQLYALCELIIGLSSLVVPPLLAYGRVLLNDFGSSAAWGSRAYYAWSGLWIAATLIPFTACMGATIPLAMAVIRRRFPAETKAFSYLYVSNVLGATLGTVAAAFILVEALGFRRSTLIAGLLNLGVAVAAWLFSRGAGLRPAAQPGTASSDKHGSARRSHWRR